MIFVQFIEHNFIELIAAFVQLFHSGIICRKGSLLFIAAIFGFEVFIKLIGNQAGKIHGIVRLGIKLQYRKQLLCATLEFLFEFIFVINFIRIVRTQFRKLFHPVSVSDLNACS